MPQVPVSNAGAALGVCGLDPDTGDAYGIGLANVTAISTAGTTTIDSAQGAFFGFTVVTLGTSPTVAAFDILAGTSTLALVATTTATAVGPQAFPGPPGLAVRYANSLVVVTGGTVGQINVLWD